MIELIVFILATFAATAIITQEYIFKWLRKLLNFKPFTCSRCMSVWVGIVLSFFFPVISNVFISPLIYGLISYTIVRFGLIVCDKNEFKLDDE